jgi:SRSO17 transposase
LQHLLTDAAWDAQALDEARVKRLLAIYPPTNGVLVFDDTGLPKKGTESVGVEPQYCGTLVVNALKSRPFLPPNLHTCPQSCTLGQRFLGKPLPIW